MIHGGIKGVSDCSKYCFIAILIPFQLNILVDDSGHARIADLGSATVAAEQDSEESTSDQLGHTPRWAAPESLNKGIYSKEADVFSFAMVMIEVCRERSAESKLQLTLISYRPRCSLVRSRSVATRLLWPCWPQHKEGARHDRHIRPSQTVCGRLCNAAEIMTLACVQKLQRSCKFFSPR